MAQRQIVGRPIKQVWASLFSNVTLQNQVAKRNSTLMLASSAKLNQAQSPLPAIKELPIANPLSNYMNSMFSERNKGFIDLFTNNPHKELYLPTLSINKLKVYEDITSSKAIIDPIVNNIKIIDAPNPGKPEKKEAVTMILIRRRKMRKHKLRRFRKKWRFVLEKIKVRRQLRKEQDFRTELLSQIEEADNFDPKKYVEKILHTIRYQPVPETAKERNLRLRELTKMNKYNTRFIVPKYDDDL